MCKWDGVWFITSTMDGVKTDPCNPCTFTTTIAIAILNMMDLETTVSVIVNNTQKPHKTATIILQHTHRAPVM